MEERGELVRRRDSWNDRGREDPHRSVDIRADKVPTSNILLALRQRADLSHVAVAPDDAARKRLFERMLTGEIRTHQTQGRLVTGDVHQSRTAYATPRRTRSATIARSSARPIQVSDCSLAFDAEPRTPSKVTEPALGRVYPAISRARDESASTTAPASGGAAPRGWASRRARASSPPDSRAQ